MINGSALYPPSPSRGCDCCWPGTAVQVERPQWGEDERPGRRRECRRSAGSARWWLRRRCGGHHRRWQDSQGCCAVIRRLPTRRWVSIDGSAAPERPIVQFGAVWALDLACW